MGKTIIGYVGVMGYQDGVDYLLRALHHLVYGLGRSDFYCILIGGGDAWLGLKMQAHELDLDKYLSLRVLSSVEKLRRYLSAADICVDSSRQVPTAIIPLCSKSWSTCR